MKKYLFLALGLSLICSCSAMKNAQYRDIEAPRDLGFQYTDSDSQTYSVSQVKPDKSTSSYTDIWSYIRGKVPGVQVGPSSAGSTPTIIIRGVGTNSGDTTPLFIVDGMEMADVSSLNPDDIESVEVLKDASSSIYGVRGGNGVIIFRTKTAAAAAREAEEIARAAKEAARAARKEARKKK